MSRSRSRSQSKRKGASRAADTRALPAPQPERRSGPSPEVDALLVRSTVRWALIVALLIAVYSIGVFAGYPYPEAIDGARAPFYVVVGVVLTLAGLFITFLGYRMVTMRVIRQGRTLYAIFLPTVMLLSATVAILMLAAPA